MREARQQGKIAILRSVLGQALVSSNPRVYKDAGHNGFADYMKGAEAAGKVILDGTGGSAFVRLLDL